MLAKDRFDWYCFHCHNGGEVILCSGCPRVFHEECLKREGVTPPPPPPQPEDFEDFEESGRAKPSVPDWFCSVCKVYQSLPVNQTETVLVKRERRDLNHLLKILLTSKMKRKMPENILYRKIPVMPSAIKIKEDEQVKSVTRFRLFIW